MATKPRGLGKGLKSLITEEPILINSNDSVVNLNIIDVEPNKDQPRKNFDLEKLEALKNSISELGVILPIIVIKNKNQSGMYTIIAGERRWRASKMAGLKTIPAIIKDYETKEAMEVALIENLQREDLNPIEEAEGYKSLIETFSMTQEEISKRVGKSRSAITNFLRILNLPNQVLEYIKENKLTQGHGRALLTLEKESYILEIAQIIINEGLNVRQVEKLVKNYPPKENKKEVKKPTSIEIELKAFEENIAKKLGTKVNIKHGAKKGKIEIEYYGNDDLDRILQFLS